MRSLFKGALSFLIVASTCLDVTLLVTGVADLSTETLAVLAIMTGMSSSVVTHYFGRDADEGDR